MVSISDRHVTSALTTDAPILSASSAVGISVCPVMHSGFWVYKYMFFCMSASLWCVLKGESKKVATEKKERWVKVCVLCGFVI